MTGMRRREREREIIIINGHFCLSPLVTIRTPLLKPNPPESEGEVEKVEKVEK